MVRLDLIFGSIGCEWASPLTPPPNYTPSPGPFPAKNAGKGRAALCLRTEVLPRSFLAPFAGKERGPGGEDGVQFSGRGTTPKSSRGAPLGARCSQSLGLGRTAGGSHRVPDAPPGAAPTQTRSGSRKGMHVGADRDPPSRGPNTVGVEVGFY